MKPLTAKLLMLLTLLGNSNGGLADAVKQHQSHSSIIAAVIEFLEHTTEKHRHPNTQIQVGHLDKRLKLQQCAQALDTYLAPGAKAVGKTTVGVRCDGIKPWAIYLPATINIYSTVYKTAHGLPRGHIIQARDIEKVEYNLAQLNYGYFSDQSKLIGMQTKRRLAQGRVITPNQVKPPLLVKRGEQVALVSRSSLFTVRMNGKAMMDGAYGDRIRVKNSSSRRIIEGKVTQAGIVMISP
ncbi:MAG: flagellar basal body P-ring formation chaperone FlgA [Gammaproteobacteria bacterium]